MALTGLQIHKLLPGTNCKECGSNTCLAFAMKLAAKKAELAACPYASDEAKQVLGAAAEPPVRAVRFGKEKALAVGEETVLYRHEKTFVNQPAFAVNVRDTDEPAAIERTLTAIGEYTLERVGETFGIDMVAVTHNGTDTTAFVELATRAWKATGKPVVVRTTDAEALTQVAAALRGSHSLLASATAQSADTLWSVAKENEHALAITAPALDDLTALSTRIKEAGFNNLVLAFQTHSLAERFQTNSIARRAALKASYKPLGHPFLHCLTAGDPIDETISAVADVCKYGGICVLPRFDTAQLATLMTLRLNIFTDPQKPIQVEPGVYPIGEPTPTSPLFVTTNFSLTYFLVSGEIENAGISAHLLVPECEGMSVLTAWAAGKFDGGTIGKFAADIDLNDRVATRTITIPGYVASISGDLEEAMPGWTVAVGPQEASDLDGFITAKLPALCP